MINVTYQNGYFSFFKDGVNIANNVRNDAFAYGNIVDFKTSEGAVISRDKISDVLIEGTAVSNVPQLFSSLYALGYFDWIGSVGGGSGGVDRFTELLDAFGFTGNNGKVPVVNESLMRLDAVTLWNYKEFTELQDVAINELVEGKFVTVAMVEGELKVVLGDLPSGVDLTGFVKNPTNVGGVIRFQVEGQDDFIFSLGGGENYDQTLGFGNTTDKTAIHEDANGRASIRPNDIRVMRKGNGANAVRFGAFSSFQSGWVFGTEANDGTFTPKGHIGSGANNNELIIGVATDPRLITLRGSKIGFGTTNGAPVYDNDFNTQAGFRNFAPISETPAANGNQVPRYDQVGKLSETNNFLALNMFSGILRVANDVGLQFDNASNRFSFKFDTILNGINLSKAGVEDGIIFAKNDTLNVGIRDINPSEALTVTGNIKASGLVILGQFTTGTEPALKIGAWYFNTTKNRMMQGRSDGWLAIDELKSPNGSKWRLQVSDTGVLTTISA